MTPQRKAPKPLKKTSQAWKNRVLELFSRDGYTCQYCFKSLPYEQLAPHHIKSKGAGGSDELFNLITLCDKCHKLVHNGNITKEQLMGCTALIGKSPYNDWPDTPREDVYKAREEYINKLISGKNPLPQKAVDEFMAEWDREHGI